MNYDKKNVQNAHFQFFSPDTISKKEKASLQVQHFLTVQTKLH